MKKFASLALVLALCLSFLTACGQSGASSQSSAAKPTVVVGTLATEDILPVWVAEEKDLLSKAGVDAQVTVFQSATELIAGVTSGSVDVAMTDPMVAASMYASGTDLSVEWVTLGATADQGRFGILTGDDSITSLNDLAGIPIGVGSNTILEYVMDTLMARAGIPADQVLKEELQKLPVRYQACASGQVKAAALPGSLLALGEASGLHVVADDTTGANLSQSVMVARTDFTSTEQGKTALAALKTAWDNAVNAINANPSDYRALLAAKANLPESIAGTYPVSTYPTCQLPEQSMIDPVLAWMKAKGYLPEGVTYNAATGTFAGR